LVSNFLLAAMLLFLFLQMAEQQVETSELRRALVETTSAAAAAQFASGTRAEALVVLPCRNEAAALPALLPALRRLEASPNLTWVVVDDASDDGSAALLARDAPDRSVRHPVRLGVSGALLTGFRVADRLDAEWVVQCDADGQHPVERVPELLAGAAQTDADVLVGSRFLAGVRSGLPSTSGLRWVGGRWLGSLLRLFGKNARVTDPTSGFRVYSRRARHVLASEMPDEYPEPECIALAALRGLRVGEWPVEMAPRTTGRSKLGRWYALGYMVKVTAALVGLRLRSLAP
ncbi:MAG TPA: glycosyltransferase family 2 protein, partial [Myxococcaceae bacterium]